MRMFVEMTALSMATLTIIACGDKVINTPFSTDETVSVSPIAEDGSIPDMSVSIADIDSAVVDASVVDASATSNADATVDATVAVTQSMCLNACSIAHVPGSALADAIDVCWAKSCNPECTVGDPNGKTYGPDPAVVLAAKVGMTVYPILTPTVVCSTCTTINCSDSWDACFGNADCVALNDCSLNCWALPR